ncbi:WG repeat-containing protein [Saccharospirillum impatiens]|uniref:WG repeat-containing protein n=1 Tax=Saccharospirillum impatiens TaxID=169438 RepID=UPI0004161793|nr:WG repeat-containing protein [Saccharospirillum impatiens]
MGFSNPNGDKPDSIGKLGILDNNRTIISEPVYDDVRPEYDSTILVKQGQQWGVVNNQNETLLPIEYQAIDIITSTFSLVKLNNRWGVFDLQEGELILPIEYDELEYLSLTQINARKNNQWSIVDI